MQDFEKIWEERVKTLGKTVEVGKKNRGKDKANGTNDRRKQWRVIYPFLFPVNNLCCTYIMNLECIDFFFCIKSNWQIRNYAFRFIIFGSSDSTIPGYTYKTPGKTGHKNRTTIVRNNAICWVLCRDRNFLLLFFSSPIDIRPCSDSFSTHTISFVRITHQQYCNCSGKGEEEGSENTQYKRYTTWWLLSLVSASDEMYLQSIHVSAA